MKRAAIIAALILAGCAAPGLDRDISRLIPVKTEQGAAFYTFTAPASAVYPEASPEAEATRMQWLRRWLDDNGHAGVPYSILERRAVLRDRALLGDSFDLYYSVSVP